MGINADEDRIQKILDKIYLLDPAGIGAKDLQQCLLLQLKRKKINKNVSNATKIIKDLFDEFSKRHFDKIKSKLNISDEELKESIYEIDKEAIDMSGGIIEPSRLFLYDIESKAPVVDYFIDQSQGQKPKDQKAVHSGLIEIDEDRKGIKYKIRISEHVKNIIRNDSLNKKLALVVTSDITNAVNTELKNNDELEYIPISSVINPLGTILYGPNPEAINHDKRFRLELFYTEINN